MKIIQLEDNEIGEVITALAMKMPLIAKIASQCATQPEVLAEGRQQHARTQAHTSGHHGETIEDVAARQGLGGGPGVFSGARHSNGERSPEAAVRPIRPNE